MSIKKEDLHPRFDEADVVIVDEDDVEEVWPHLDHRRQTMLSEDEYTSRSPEFNLIAGPIEGLTNPNGPNKPGAATQVGYHVLQEKSVLDLRDHKGGFDDYLFGLGPLTASDENEPE